MLLSERFCSGPCPTFSAAEGKVASTHRKRRGFTLIEMLVVMAIIAVLMTAVAINLGLGGQEPEEQLETEIQRLYELARLAEDQAVISGEPVGLAILPPDEEPEWRYHWRRYRGGEWLETQAPLSPQVLPENVEVALNIEGVDVNLAQALEQWDELEQQRLRQQEQSRRRGSEEEPTVAQEMPPSIVFYPGGEVTPFLLTLYDNTALDLRASLGSSLRGKVEIVPEDEELWE